MRASNLNTLTVNVETHAHRARKMNAARARCRSHIGETVRSSFDRINTQRSQLVSRETYIVITTEISARCRASTTPSHIKESVESKGEVCGIKNDK